ncbi:MAG TPA: single-stranded-DNA-specific exonuclease RecJ [Candidatus Blautia gallistercoris]|uniref:Single-stranded-DNA-specific exonuclease RecJ n=1 Tax=Candidatus Blautia gallistercoris TaxID=2838490 RepID=A0A9D2B2E3_9FIRM|nr:single-stranded-DNA-specific exonuclease RecJ [Candidatus Blautia gallistercoris]
MTKRFVVAAKRADFQKLGQQFSVDPVIARIIRNRDVIGEEEIRTYLYGGLEQLQDARVMKHMEQAAGILQEKIMSGAAVRIIGDYDIDGVMATCILKKGLTILGGQVDTCLPDRIADGYGLNENLIRRAQADGIDTILTCDNGIAAGKEIQMAKELGMTVVVTDHHEVPYRMEGKEKISIIPPADAVVDPRQQDCPYPFKKLCGAAVAYKLMEVLFQDMEREEEFPEEFLEFAAIATVGDVMDLQGENRILVREGLKRIQHSSNPGIRALIRANGLEDRKITAYHIGFVLGPCINASGRLDTAGHALELFLASPGDAPRLAGDLVAMNASRKALTEQGVEQAVEKVEHSALKEDRVLVVYLPDCHESLAGIIAGRLRERYYRPVFVLTKSEQGVKGSGRSIEGYSMYDELNACGELLDKYGGHPMAAGLTLEEEKVELLRQRLNENCTLTEEEMSPKVVIDVPMPISYITRPLIEELELLEPFGKGNSKPVFAQKGLRLLDCRVLGKNQNVVKMKVEDGQGCCLEGIYFGETSFVLDKAASGEPVSVIYYPSVNSYQGRETIQIVIQDIF